jgi:NADP-dependent aldehyde dehydrogenase
MEITGQQLIAGTEQAQGRRVFKAFDMTIGNDLAPVFYNATEEEVALAVTQAGQAYQEMQRKGKDQLAEFLEEIANQIQNLGDALIQRAQLETALPAGRLQGERGRTMGQLRLFAQVVREGSWIGAVIDTADPERAPVPKPDIRQLKQGLGPVAVFGASNFPLAFSVAGGDTASALAAGCPVVVKAHPAHPGTSELVGRAIQKAVVKCGMPQGVFGLLQGDNHKVGAHLVNHPGIKAVGFTGSFQGGKALFDLANARPEPIPVFAEMGSNNPVFITEKALAERSDQIANGLAASVNLGAGQFCTSPGIVFVPNTPKGDTFVAQLTQAMEQIGQHTLLTQGIAKGYTSGVQKLKMNGAVPLVGKRTTADFKVANQLFTTTSADFNAKKKLYQEEVFGPCTVVVRAEEEEYVALAAALQGNLTASLHAANEETGLACLVGALKEKVGRLVYNGFPTGVEVGHGMVHGGPFPATTAPNSTSVGSRAIERFVRMVCYQDFPQELLPLALQDANPDGIIRTVNGELSKASILSALS